MQTGLHAIGWGLQRLAIAVGAAALLIFFAYVVLVTVIVVGQAASTFGQ
jgi:hypothetical protein